MSEQWSYAKGGVQQGPVSLDELRRMLAAGELTGTDLAWRPGMANWAAITTMEELTAAAELPVATAVTIDKTHVVSYQGNMLDSMNCTVRTMELYRQTKPWVRIVSVFLWIGMGLMCLSGLVVLGLAAGGMVRQQHFVLFIYLPLGILYIFPALYLTRYASHLGALMRMQTPETLEKAVEAQKSFWKFVAIAMLTVVGIYFVIIILATVMVILRKF